MQIFDAQTFTTEVLEYPGDVLVDFYADWCGPCQQMAPVLEDFSQAHPEWRIGKVNIEEQPELAARYGVQSIPTLILFRHGTPVDRAIGFTPPAQLEQLFLG